MNLKFIKETFYLRSFGLMKVPLIAFLSPEIVELNEKECAIKIKLGYRSKNHLGCMYFGALSVGADISGALVAMKAIRESGQNVSLIFKDFQAYFLKRAEGDVVFTCQDIQETRDLVQQAITSGERVQRSMRVIARVPSISSDPVAEFTLTLSLKKK